MMKARSSGTYNYEATIETLNSLQSNSDYLKKRANANITRKEERAQTLSKMINFVERSGLQWENVDNLSIIHVTGTKGKGSTCAYCESILRHHGFRTGFYSSPHLIEVVERIKINGASVNRNKFVSGFWSIYNNLLNTKNANLDMPIYFQMLTLLAFKIFIEEKVDVAIIEVGIGGEYDSTNFIRNTSIAGISSLGIDHVALLGDTVEKIAWHKAGIMKPGCKTFTVPQPKEAFKVLQERSIEKDCSLQVVNNDANGYVRDSKLPHHIYNLNASLAIALSKSWMEGKNINFSNTKMIKALQDCHWPGRYQIFHTEHINYYLDGAHTEKSLEYCVNWFLEKTKTSTNKKALLFNNTGDRDSKNHMQILQRCSFAKVFFTPNIATHQNADCVNIKVSESEQLSKISYHKKLWEELKESDSNEVHAFPNVDHVLHYLMDGNTYDMLVTGSLHLVGTVLSIIDPELIGYHSQLEKSAQARKVS